MGDKVKNYKQYNAANQVEKRASFSMQLIGKIISFLVLLIIAWIFSVVFEWLGMAFIWEEEGALHSERMLRTELHYLNDDFRRSVFGVTPLEFATTTASHVDYWLFEATLFRDILAWVLITPPDAHHFRLSLAQTLNLLQAYIAAGITTTQLFGVRLAIALLCMPAFLLVGIAALIDGLVRRDIRRFSGANESSFIYHNVKPWVKPAFIGAWFIYLGIPVAMHPNLIFIPASVLFGLSIYITSAMFKKYL